MKKIWSLAALILCVLIFLPPGSAAGQSSGITTGDTVEVNTSGSILNLRSSPGLEATVLARMPDGTRMVVVGGPQSADGYTWWELSGDPGRGWAVETYLIVVPARSSNETPPGENCQLPYDGIQYCQSDDSQVHMLIIQLDDPHVRFETILAGDVTSVNTDARESVNHMATRPPYQNGIAAVMNADYFGAGHGPEGLTIKNGLRLDGIDRGDGDGGAVKRSSLAIGESTLDGGSGKIPADITRLIDDRQPLEAAFFYNAVGGGPQVIYDGGWKWERDPGNPDIINGEEFVGTTSWDSPTTRWTAVAVTDDSRMIWIIAPYPMVSSSLLAYPVTEALKLDGGGSSQLWVAGDYVVPSSDDRQVAEGLGVFYLHAMTTVSSTQWPVVVEGETVKLSLEVRNTGADTWLPGEVYLRNINGPYQAQTDFPISAAVPPGETVAWEWTTVPFTTWGIKQSEWELVYKGTSFADPSIKMRIVVIPEKLEQKKDEIQKKILEWLNQGREDLEKLIIDYINQRLESWIAQILSTCLPGQTAFLLGLVVVAKVRHGRRRT